MNLFPWRSISVLCSGTGSSILSALQDLPVALWPCRSKMEKHLQVLSVLQWVISFLAMGKNAKLTLWEDRAKLCAVSLGPVQSHYKQSSLDDEHLFVFVSSVTQVLPALCCWCTCSALTAGLLLPCTQPGSSLTGTHPNKAQYFKISNRITWPKY